MLLNILFWGFFVTIVMFHATKPFPTLKLNDTLFSNHYCLFPMSTLWSHGNTKCRFYLILQINNIICCFIVNVLLNYFIM